MLKQFCVNILGLSIFFFGVGSVPAGAQDGDVQDFVMKEKAKSLDSEKMQPGWNPAADISGNASLISNRNVVGQTEGSTVTLGGQLNSEWIYLNKGHEWRNTVSVQQSLTKTPSISEFVKTADELKYQALYLYHLEQTQWLGPYARLALNTNLFKGVEETAESVNYSVRKVDGTVDSVTTKSLHLTDPFRPLTLRQALGGFVKMADKETFKVEGRLGLGAQQVFVEDQLVISDDDSTENLVEVEEVSSYSEGGFEAALTIAGRLRSKSKYSLSAEIFYPVVRGEDSEASQGKSSLKLSSVDLSASLSSPLTSWASFSYELAALRQPLVVSGFQIQHNLLLNVSYSIF